MADYYYRSWESFLTSTLPYIKAGKKPAKTEQTSAEHFMDALRFVLNDKEYQSVPSDPEGDLTSRGLKAIFNYIKENYSTKIVTYAEPALKKIKAVEDSAITRSGALLNGVTDGSTVDALIASLVLPDGCSVTVSEFKGSDRAGADKVATGDRLTLKNADGDEIDVAIVGSVSYSEADAAEAENCMNALREYVEYIDSLDTEGFDEKTLSKVEKAYDVAKTALSSGITYSLSVLKDYAVQISSAKTAAENAYAELHPEPVDTPEPTPEPSGLPGWVIPVAIAGALVVIAAIVAAIIVGKKKKK